MLKITYFVGLSYLLIATNIVRCKPEYLFNKDAGGWLKLHRIPGTWYEAFQICHYEGAVLASPLNKQLATALTSQLTQSGVKCPIFLGTHDLYSKGHFTSIEGVPLAQMETNWSDEVGTYDCLSMAANSTKFYMKTASCNERRPFICYRKHDNQTMNVCGTFDNAYHYNKRTGSCYKLHNQLKSWSKAYKICDSEGAYLVILNNKEEADIIKEMFLDRSQQDRMHIGLSAWTDDRIWITIHGDKLKDVFNKWDNGEPNNRGGNQKYVAYLRQGVLDDSDLDFKTIFVCEKSPKSKQFQDLSETIDERNSY